MLRVTTPEFAYEEIRSALRLYFGPLLWIAENMRHPAKKIAPNPEHIYPRQSEDKSSGPDAPAGFHVPTDSVVAEVPIRVRGSQVVEDQHHVFSESTKTVLVFEQGAVIVLTAAVSKGQLLSITNESAGSEAVCRVIRSEDYETGKLYVEIEFLERQDDFWVTHSLNSDQEQGTDLTSSERSATLPAPAGTQGATVIDERVIKPFERRGTSVKDDWRAWLPLEEDQIFRRSVRRLESLYNVLSISLDEAIELRRLELKAQAHSAVGISPDLCTRFVDSLTRTLRAMSEHAKHHGTTPNVAPLSPENFQGARGQRAALLNALLNRVLFSERSQFLYKTSILAELAEDSGEDFSETASRLSIGGTDADTASNWYLLEAAHYDLNTCLRETIVMLKSFLLALPEAEVMVFELEIELALWSKSTRERNRRPWDTRSSGLLTAEQIAFARKGS